MDLKPNSHTASLKSIPKKLNNHKNDADTTTVAKIKANRCADNTNKQESVYVENIEDQDRVSPTVTNAKTKYEKIDESIKKSKHRAKRQPRSLIDRLSNPSNHRGIKRKISTAVTDEQLASLDVLSDRELKMLKSQKLAVLQDLKKTYDIDIDVKAMEEQELEDIIITIVTKTREGEISRIAKGKENSFFGWLWLGCSLAELFKFNASRVYQEQDKNRQAYKGIFYQLAIREYETEGEVDYHKQLVQTAALGIAISLVAVVVEKYTGQKALADIFQNFASSLTRDDGSADTQQQSVNPMTSLFSSFLG